MYGTAAKDAKTATTDKFDPADLLKNVKVRR